MNRNERKGGAHSTLCDAQGCGQEGSLFQESLTRAQALGSHISLVTLMGSPTFLLCLSSHVFFSLFLGSDLINAAPGRAEIQCSVHDPVYPKRELNEHAACREEIAWKNSMNLDLTHSKLWKFVRRISRPHLSIL